MSNGLGNRPSVIVCIGKRILGEAIHEDASPNRSYTFIPRTSIQAYGAG